MAALAASAVARVDRRARPALRTGATRHTSGGVARADTRRCCRHAAGRQRACPARTKCGKSGKVASWPSATAAAPHWALRTSVALHRQVAGFSAAGVDWFWTAAKRPDRRDRHPRPGGLARRGPGRGFAARGQARSSAFWRKVRWTLLSPRDPPAPAADWLEFAQGDLAAACACAASEAAPG